MADPEESPNPESGSDSHHGEESDPYRPDPSASDDEETLFLPGEQLLTEVSAGLNIEETGSQGRAGDQEQQTSAPSHRARQRRKPKKPPTPLPSSSLSIEDPAPLPADFDFPILTSAYWGNCPTSSEEYGTVEGENARLWMQAETDLALEDAPDVPAPGQKRPIDLLDVLDKRLRKIHSAVFRRTGNAGYTWLLVFSTTSAAIPNNRKETYARISITPNREVISDVLLNDLDERQIEDIRKSIHPFFERLHTVPNVPSVFEPQAFPELVPHDVCFVAPEVQRTACRIMVFLQSMFHTRMIVRSGVRVYQNALLEWFGYRSFSNVAMKGKDSLYRGGPLVTVSIHAGHYSLDPSQTLQEDVRTGFFNTVRVPLSAAALLSCIEVLDTVYVRTGSRRKAWLALSKKADHENVLAENGTAFTPLPNTPLDEDTTAFRYQASYIAFRKAFLQDVLDQEYQPGATKTQAFDNKKSLVFDAWLTFMEQWKIGESEFVDAYSGITQPYIESRSDWEARFPFLLSPDAVQPDPLIASVQTQNNAGIANADNCLAIKRPWALQSDNWSFSKFGRPADSKAPYKDYTFNRIEGAVYLFNWENRPVEWTRDDNRRFYSVMLERMIEECNKDYETTCTVDTLFLVHCLRVACPPKGLEWLYYELEPYVHHPFRASGGHAAHGLNMTTGWPEDYETLDDFVEEDCNIDIEPWIWNMMRGGLDHHYDAIVDYIRNLPRDNPPYWQESLGSGPLVPLTIWGGAVRHVRFRAKKRGPATSTSRPEQQQEIAVSDTGRQSRQRSFPTGVPQRGNLSNKDQICYASAIIQMLCNVPKLRAIISATSNLPFDVNTGRGLHGFVLLGDPGFVIHQNIFSQLRQIASTLEATNTRLPADCTLEFLRTLRQINTQTCQEFPEAGEFDPSTLLGVLLETLNDAGDRSKPLTDTIELRPNRVWLKNQEEAVKAGRLIAPLSEDVPLQFNIHKDIGNDSELDDLCTLRVVYESVCSVESCQSPFSRGFSFEQVLNLQFPQDDPTGVYKVSDLIESWSVGSGRAVCGYDNSHGLALPAKKMILTTPEILFLRIERLSLGDLMTSGGIFEAENAAQIVSNPLIVEENIDLQPWCSRDLPSERRLGPLPEQMRARATHYGIDAIVQYHNRHFFTYAKAKDQDGNLFWARFDDTLLTVVWENPLQINHRTGDFILVYKRLSKAEVLEALAVPATSRTPHQPEPEEDIEEIEEIENLNAANETGDLSDYEDSIGDSVNIHDILNDEGDASDNDDDVPEDSEARKGNKDITEEEYSRKSVREKAEYFEEFFKSIAETADSDAAEVLFGLAARVRSLGEESQAALDSKQSRVSPSEQESDWDAAVKAAVQQQPKQFQDHLDRLKAETRKIEKRLDNLRQQDQIHPRKKSSRVVTADEAAKQSARGRLQELMFEEHNVSSRLSSLKKELEAVQKERDLLRRQTDTLRSKEHSSASSVTSMRPEDLVGQLRDRMHDLSPQTLGDLIQQATMQLVSRTTAVASEDSQKQLSKSTQAIPKTLEPSQTAMSPSIRLAAGPTGAIVSRSDAHPTSSTVRQSADVPSSTSSQLTAKAPGSAHEPMVIDSDPPESDDVEQPQDDTSRYPAPFTPFPVPSSASQHGVMNPPGRTPQTGERRPYDMIRSPAISPSRQGGPESPLKKHVVGTTASSTTASPSLSTQRHGLGPAPPEQYGGLQSRKVYQAAHTGPPGPTTHSMTPGGFQPYKAAPPAHGFKIQAPTTVSQAGPNIPSTVGSVESPSTSRLPTSGPSPPAYNVPAPTSVSQAAPTVSSTVGNVAAPQLTSRLPVPVRSSETVAPSSGATNLPAGGSQQGQEVLPNVQPSTRPPSSVPSSGTDTGSSHRGHGALAGAQPNTRPHTPGAATAFKSSSAWIRTVFYKRVKTGSQRYEREPITGQLLQGWSSSARREGYEG
ncbi:hypothetical protein KC361_g2710 [Hortaea werneckii]|nr:hypothetical protein KC361_g2710 [Hortaea werneckii]